MSLTVYLSMRRTKAFFDGRIEMRFSAATCEVMKATPLAVVPFKLQTFSEVAAAVWHLMQAYRFVGEVDEVCISRTSPNKSTPTTQWMDAGQVREVWSSEETARAWFAPTHFHYPKQGGSPDGPTNR